MRTEFDYHHFAYQLDVDAVEGALGFETTSEGCNKLGDPLDLGYCIDPWGLHKNGDTTGKLAINRERRTYNCWVCGHGTLLDLAMTCRDLTEPEAETWLFQFTQIVEASDQDFLSEIDAILYAERAVSPPMPFFNEHVLDRFTASVGDDWARWLSGRGISTEVAHEARVGYQEACLRPRYKEGKVIDSYTGASVYLPHFWGGRLVGWQQRWLDEDRPKWIAKYTNTSGFPKSETIHGFEDVYFAERPIIVVESVPTRLFLKSLGYPAVALFGGVASLEQMRLLRKCQQGLVLAPDNDGPGWKWLDWSETERRSGKFDRVILAKELARFVPVKIIEPVGEFGSGNDLNDLVDEGLPFARQAVEVLYNDAEWY